MHGGGDDFDIPDLRAGALPSGDSPAARPSSNSCAMRWRCAAREAGARSSFRTPTSRTGRWASARWRVAAGLVRTGRRCTLLARRYDEFVRRTCALRAPGAAPGRTSSRRVPAARADRWMPSAIWSPGWVLQRLDLERCNGVSGSEPETARAAARESAGVAAEEHAVFSRDHAGPVSSPHGPPASPKGFRA